MRDKTAAMQIVYKILCRNINPNVAKVGGLQSQGAKGEAVVVLLRTPGNAGSEVLRLSRRVNKGEDKSIHSSNYPLANSREYGQPRFRLKLYKCLQDFRYLFYATLGLSFPSC
jgi:hypothetical protein